MPKPSCSRCCTLIRGHPRAEDALVPSQAKPWLPSQQPLLCPGATCAVPAAGNRLQHLTPLPSPLARGMLAAGKRQCRNRDLRSCRSSVGKAMHAVLASSSMLRDVGSDFRGPTAANPHPQTQSLSQATSLPQEKAVAQSWSHRHALAAELRSYFSLPCKIPCTPCPWQHFPPLLSTASPPEVGLPLPFSCSKASIPAWLWAHQSEK